MKPDYPRLGRELTIIREAYHRASDKNDQDLIYEALSSAYKFSERLQHDTLTWMNFLKEKGTNPGEYKKLEQDLGKITDAMNQLLDEVLKNS